MDEEDPAKVKGYNIAVGGGMGRTHGKEETMPFAAEHLGYVEAKDMFNVVKSILCVQRDHGRRDDRKMSRFKYVVAEFGIDKIRDLVEEYSTVKIQDWVPIPAWEYKAYLGWHEQGDGKWFLGLNIDTGRIKDDGDVRMKSALREIVGRYQTPCLFTAQQNIMLSEIEEENKVHIERILSRNNIQMDHEISDLQRDHMACPALPMCGLATTEAERLTPAILACVDNARKAAGVPDLELVTRVTGCPNGCARTYMAEIGFVGSGPMAYQLWLGGSHNQTRTSQEYDFRIKFENMEELLTNLFTVYKECRNATNESFGDFCYRAGSMELKTYIDALEAKDDAGLEKSKAALKDAKMPEYKYAKDFIGGIPDATYKTVSA